MYFGERIRQQREKRGLTQTETANAIGISQVVYCQYECGAKCPNINVAAKLAKLFGVSLDYLVGVVDDENG